MSETVDKVNRAAILGMGKSGIGAATLLANHGVEVRGYDQQAEGRFAFKIGADQSVPVVREPDGRQLAQCIVDWNPDVVVVSPGIPLHSAAVQGVRQAGLPLWGEIELAWQVQGAGPHRDRPWILVTGTNGKTTTVGMVEAILRSGGVDARQAGNVGVAVTSLVDSPAEMLIVEASSFQLETAPSLQPAASICLNVDADHLDWHGSVAAYRAAKAKVYDGTRRVRCAFADDPVTIRMAEAARRADGSMLRELTLGVPARGQTGIVGDAIVEMPAEAREPIELARLSQIPALGAPPSPALTRDAVAAAALTRAVGAAPEWVAAGLAEFHPAAHRGSIVGIYRGVTWVDDSKATNAHAALATLSGLPDGRAVWIVGGDPKGQDLHDLVGKVAPKLRAAIAIGADRTACLSALVEKAPGIPVAEIGGEGSPETWMPDLVRACAEKAQPGDWVVLAPACASWDQFDNYGQRGDLFAAAVRAEFADPAASGQTGVPTEGRD